MRNAFVEDSPIQNVAQFDDEEGTLAVVELASNTGAPWLALLADGSEVCCRLYTPLCSPQAAWRLWSMVALADAVAQQVYGSARAVGWLAVFRRYALTLPGGHYLLLDMFK